MLFSRSLKFNSPRGMVVHTAPARRPGASSRIARPSTPPARPPHPGQDLRRAVNSKAFRPKSQKRGPPFPPSPQNCLPRQTANKSVRLRHNEIRSMPCARTTTAASSVGAACRIFRGAFRRALRTLLPKCNRPAQHSAPNAPSAAAERRAGTTRQRGTSQSPFAMMYGVFKVIWRRRMHPDAPECPVLAPALTELIFSPKIPQHQPPRYLPPFHPAPLPAGLPAPRLLFLQETIRLRGEEGETDEGARRVRVRTGGAWFTFWPWQPL